MALVGDYVRKEHYTVPNAYHKIQVCSGSKEQGYTAVVALYCDEAARTASLDNFLWNDIVVTADYVADEAAHVTIYNKMKTMPQFQHLTDHP